MGILNHPERKFLRLENCMRPNRFANAIPQSCLAFCQALIKSSNFIAIIWSRRRWAHEFELMPLNWIGISLHLEVNSWLVPRLESLRSWTPDGDHWNVRILQFFTWSLKFASSSIRIRIQWPLCDWILRSPGRLDLRPSTWWHASVYSKSRDFLEPQTVMCPQCGSSTKNFREKKIACR